MEQNEELNDVILGKKLSISTQYDGSSDPFMIEPEKIRGHQKISSLRKAATVNTFGKDGANSKAGHEMSSYKTAYGYMELARPVYDQELLVALHESDGTHFAAIEAKVANVVGLGYDLVKSSGAKAKENKLEDDSEDMLNFRRSYDRKKQNMIEFLDELNSQDDFIDIILRFYMDYEITGNGYLEVGRTPNGLIGYVGHIPSKDMRVRRSRDGFVQMVSGKPIFFRNFGDTSTADRINADPQPNEILHLKKYCPRDYYYGAPVIIPAMKALAGNQFADDFNIDYFENKAVPRHVIILRGDLAKDQRQKLVNFFDSDLKGSHHRTLFVPLPANTAEKKHDIEFKPVEAGTQESSFNDYIKSNVTKILMVHRVPATKLGVVEDVALAVAADADKTFKEQICRPIQSLIEKHVNKIIKEFSNVFLFKLNELTLTDEIEQATIDQIGYQIGIVTPNEIRARKGLAGLEGGDDTYQQTAQEAADVKASQAGTKQRDQDRAAQRTDSVGRARNAKGEGRRQE